MYNSYHNLPITGLGYQCYCWASQPWAGVVSGPKVLVVVDYHIHSWSSSLCIPFLTWNRRRYLQPGGCHQNRTYTYIHPCFRSAWWWCHFLLQWKLHHHVLSDYTSQPWGESIPSIWDTPWTARPSLWERLHPSLLGNNSSRLMVMYVHIAHTHTPASCSCTLRVRVWW